MICLFETHISNKSAGSIDNKIKYAGVDNYGRAVEAQLGMMSLTDFTQVFSLRCLNFFVFSDETYLERILIVS